MADDSQPGGRSRFLIWTAALMIFLPIFYFLSTGPVAFLADKTGGLSSPLHPMIMVVYAPLIWLEGHNEPFGNFIDAYIGLFGVR